MNVIKTVKLFILCVIIGQVSFSQEKQLTQKLDTVVITSTRIDLPFSKNSRTIKVISSKEIKKSTATNVTELLQQVAGIDMRKRGAGNVQADLYIRGGGFDQTLILIDGIKVENPQTGHHTMNMALPLEVIKRVEIIKGAAARIFGQNAYTGAINIVTKTNADKVNSVALQIGSFKQKNGSLTFGKNFGNTSVITHASINTSDGYRFNTDFKNYNYFIKTTFNKNKTPINVLGYFSERKFGANGFYASPKFINQYEETASSLLGVTSSYKFENLTVKPRIYWKRGQDMYLFVRNKPSVYRNMHIYNKVGGEINMSYTSKLGITGFGFDIARVFLVSNRLGDRRRLVTNTFLEHRFAFFNGKLDVTPGASINYFSDFGSFFFPGIDIGYQVNNEFKIYANLGYTHRVPTYTDLYISGGVSVGNKDLVPEKAISEEIGVKYTNDNFFASVVGFHRDSKVAIDYVKNEVKSPWKANNFNNSSTYGVELNTSLNFKMASYNQKIDVGYTYIKDNLKNLNYKFSRYSINSLRHHFTTTFKSQFFKNLKQSISYKLGKRAKRDAYNVLDAKITYNIKGFELFVIGNNILNEEYSETNLVPMPKANFLLGVGYKF